jgi:hypothetical protein
MLAASCTRQQSSKVKYLDELVLTSLCLWFSDRIYLGNCALIVFMVAMNILAWRGYRVPTQLVEIESPLRHHKYIVINGGTSPQINAHAKIQPQNYALDLVGLNNLGRNTNWTFPKDKPFEK